MKTKLFKTGIKIGIVAVMLASANGLFSQNICISASGATPDNSAMLDVQSTSKGMLIPRMTQAQRDLIGSPATGLLIFQTDGSSGFYYYNGTGWTAVGKVGWELTGNNGTTPGTNYIGTSDAQDLVLKTNGTERLRALSGGNIGLYGTNRLVFGGTSTVLPNIYNNGVTEDMRFYTRAGYITTLDGDNNDGANDDFIIQDGAGTPNKWFTIKGATGRIGIGTDAPTSDISFLGNSNKSIDVLTSTSGAGNSLTLQAGNALASGTDINGGYLVLSGGASEGTGYSRISFKVAKAGSTGSTTNTPVEVFGIGGSSNNISITDASFNLSHASPTPNDGMSSYINGASVAAFSLWGASNCPTTDGTGYGNATSNIAVSGQMMSSRQYSFGLHAMMTACSTSPATLPNHSAGVYGTYTNSATTMQSSGALGYKDGSGNYFGVYGQCLGGAGYYAGGFAYDILFPTTSNDFYMTPATANYGYIGTSTKYYYYMHSNNFVDPSRKELKRNITYINENNELTDYVINDIKKIKPAFYKYKIESDNLEKGNETKYRPNLHLGVILEEAPDYIQDNEFSGIDLYGIATLGLFGSKYAIEKIEKLEAEIELLKKILDIVCEKSGIDKSIISVSSGVEVKKIETAPPIEGLKVDSSKKVRFERTIKPLEINETYKPF